MAPNAPAHGIDTTSLESILIADDSRTTGALIGRFHGSRPQHGLEVLGFVRRHQFTPHPPAQQAVTLLNHSSEDRSHHVES
jgi:hypothetical protein